MRRHEHLTQRGKDRGVKKWKITHIDECPICCGDLEIYTAQLSVSSCRDGDPARCVECGFEGAMSVDEDGSAWVQDPVEG